MKECAFTIAALVLQARHLLHGNSSIEHAIAVETMLALPPFKVTCIRRRNLLNRTREQIIGWSTMDFLHYAIRSYTDISLISLRVDDHDHMECPRYGGGCSWNLIGQGQGKNDVWQVLFRNQSGQRSAELRLTHRISDDDLPDQSREIAGANLIESLSEAASYASDHQMAEEEQLLDALGLMVSDENVLPTPLTWVPAIDMSSAASRRMLEAIHIAWPYTKRGKWTRPSMSMPEPERFAITSERLYRSMCNAIAAAASEQLHAGQRTTPPESGTEKRCASDDNGKNNDG